MNKNKIGMIDKAQRLLDFLCNEMEREAPLHNAWVFLTVAQAHARGEALEVKEIQKRTGLKSASLSRALGALGEWSYKGRAGLDLVTSRPDFQDRRRKPMVLTKKGEKLAAKVAELMEE